LVNIFEKGLLSHTVAHALKINKSDISNRMVQARRKHVHNKVPLYFNILNPMTYTYPDSEKSSLAILRIDKEVMRLPGAIFSDGNAASSATKFYTTLNELDKLDWNCINATYWSAFNDGKRIRCAEVLVPQKISKQFIREVYFNDSATYNNVVPHFSNEEIPFSINKSYFFAS